MTSDYAFGRTLNQYERLTEQGDLFRPLTERMLLAAGIKGGMHVLDLSCLWHTQRSAAPVRFRLLEHKLADKMEKLLGT